MIEHAEPDETLLSMPSFRSVRTFVAAARHQNFTRAAEALCVTQAAVSRQIRELEYFLDTRLFSRDGKSVVLTPAGQIFFDAVQLSSTNIAQAAQRIRGREQAHISSRVTISCSAAFLSCWLSRHLPDFLTAHPDVHVRLISTHDFLAFEPGSKPDLVICKLPDIGADYTTAPLFHDVIYPVASPDYVQTQLAGTNDLRDAKLLDLTPYGRSQIAEHVDWNVWLAHCSAGTPSGESRSPSNISSNDYRALIQLAADGFGVALGWDHLIRPWLDSGQLLRVGERELVFENAFHYLATQKHSAEREAVDRLSRWLVSRLGQ